MKAFLRKAEAVYAMQWDGQEGKLTDWLTDNGYMWRIQEPSDVDVKEFEAASSVVMNAVSECDSPWGPHRPNLDPVLFVVGVDRFHYISLRPTDWLVLFAEGKPVIFRDESFRTEYVV